MKILPGVMALSLLLPVLGPGPTVFGAGAGERNAGMMQPGGPPDLAPQLAAQVRDIAGTPLLSHGKKEKRIATAVRVAVVAATAYQQDPDAILGVAVDLAAAAARAAPGEAEVIANAVAFTPSVARIGGAPGQIRAAALAAATSRSPRREARLAATRPTVPAGNPEYAPEAQVPAAPGRPVAARPGRPAEGARGEEAVPAPPAVPVLPGGGNSSLHFTADVGARYDSNIFLSESSPVSDTIESFAPGVEYRFGQRSLAHGSLVYQEAFTRYARKSASNVNLGSGSADFGYKDDRLDAGVAGTYQELYQANADVLTLGQRSLFRSNILNLDGHAETELTAKTSGRLEMAYRDTRYRTPGFTDNTYLQWPAKLYFKATPKLDLSTGVTYGLERPQGGGPTGKDWYYNIGARGAFTAKISGEIDVGYQTRQVADNPRDSIWAFNGAIGYQPTEKTTATLNLSRQFNASALGQTLKNGQYQLGVSTQVTPQWQVGTTVAHRDLDYGAAVFAPGSGAPTVHRLDHYWEGSLLTSYLYSSWLSATASYAYRKNHSTVAGLDFTDNLWAILLALRY